MTAPADFQGIEFCTAMGEVYGLRTWRVDYYGRLKALHVTTAPAWRPGVNVATCHKREDDYALGGWINAGYTSALSYSFTKALGGLYVAPAGTPAPEPPKVEKAPKPEPKPPHETPTETCACGFYAYTDPRHEEAANYRGEGYVTGIVCGTGRTLIGTKGFRCEKAEIVAMLDPTRGGKKSAEWRTDQRAKLGHVYPDVPLIASRDALLQFAPIETTLPDPSTDEFWSLP